MILQNLLMNKFLTYLKENPDCLYIYSRDFSIYGLSKIDNEYTVIVKDTWELSKDWIGLNLEDHSNHVILEFNNDKFYIYTISIWFDMVLHNDITCWICSCINKKFIIKEHVKLLMKPNILDLRKYIDAEFDPYFLYGQSLLDSGNYNKGKQILWEIIRDIKFVNQIYENHKIVNFKEANSDWNTINNSQDTDSIVKAWLDAIVEPIKLLHVRTDDLLRSEKIKRVLQNE